jgi:excisionase family DNA binding protein
VSTAETSTTRLLTLAEVARRLTVSRATAYRMVYDGRLPAVRLGGRGAALRVDEAELERWLYAEEA